MLEREAEQLEQQCSCSSNSSAALGQALPCLYPSLCTSSRPTPAYSLSLSLCALLHLTPSPVSWAWLRWPATCHTTGRRRECLWDALAAAPRLRRGEARLVTLPLPSSPVLSRPLPSSPFLSLPLPSSPSTCLPKLTSRLARRVPHAARASCRHLSRLAFRSFLALTLPHSHVRPRALCRAAHVQEPRRWTRCMDWRVFSPLLLSLLSLVRLPLAPLCQLPFLPASTTPTSPTNARTHCRRVYTGTCRWRSEACAHA